MAGAATSARRPRRRGGGRAPARGAGLAAVAAAPPSRRRGSASSSATAATSSISVRSVWWPTDAITGHAQQRDGAAQRLVAEGQQVGQRAAAAGDDDHLDLARPPRGPAARGRSRGAAWRSCTGAKPQTSRPAQPRRRSPASTSSRALPPSPVTTPIVRGSAGRGSASAARTGPRRASARRSALDLGEQVALAGEPQAGDARRRTTARRWRCRGSSRSRRRRRPGRRRRASAPALLEVVAPHRAGQRAVARRAARSRPWPWRGAEVRRPRRRPGRARACAARSRSASAYSPTGNGPLSPLPSIPTGGIRCCSGVAMPRCSQPPASRGARRILHGAGEVGAVRRSSGHGARDGSRARWRLGRRRHRAPASAGRTRPSAGAPDLEAAREYAASAGRDDLVRAADAPPSLPLRRLPRLPLGERRQGDAAGRLPQPAERARAQADRGRPRAARPDDPPVGQRRRVAGARLRRQRRARAPRRPRRDGPLRERAELGRHADHRRRARASCSCGSTATSSAATAPPRCGCCAR